VNLKILGMDNSLKGKIRTFIIEGFEEQRVAVKPDLFWQKLKDVGTELWLDTGDMLEAEKIWTAEMTALTTNNTLVNKEIQKGIYDDFIAEAIEIVKHLPQKEQIIEIAFILNARHGLRLAKKFGGMVSVELHTDLAHKIDATIEYGKRYFDICPDQFIVKVPYTAAGLIAARKLREEGVKINFTLEFSARQNVLVAAITRPNYLNVFLGRIGAYISDTDLKHISEDGKIPKHERWAKRIANGELAIDTLLNLAGLASFTADQAQLDERIERIIG
jgi:transaldolase